MEENLGATAYLRCNLADQRCAPAEPIRVARLLITYHTGQPDPVPHRPEECLVAGGMRLRDGTTIDVAVPYRDREIAIPVKVLEFGIPQRQTRIARPGDGDEPSLIVAYFFYATETT